MNFMLCRNRVSDYRRWRRVFDSHAGAHRAAGLRLRGLWREIGKPNEIFSPLFEAGNMRKAKAFISAPIAARAGAASGVVDGEYHFIRAAEMAGYRRRG
jgi:hypothetical protein